MTNYVAQDLGEIAAMFRTMARREVNYAKHQSVTAQRNAAHRAKAFEECAAILDNTILERGA